MARNRLLLLGGAVALAAIVVVVVVLVAGSGGSNDKAAPTTTSSGGNAPASAFAGVPQHGDTLGKPSAPVTLTVFEDPQCPYCRQWNLDTLPTVVRDYVKTGRIKVVYRGIVVISDNSLAGIAAAYAAGRQNKLWDVVEVMYRRQGDERSGWITVPLIKDVARDAGANPAKVVADADTAAVSKQVRASLAEAQRLGINGTPTFAITKPLGTMQQLQVPGLEPSDFTPALDAQLQ